MPKAFLHPRLELSIMKSLVLFARPDKATAPRRPSEVFNYLQSVMAAIQRVDDAGR
jgi:hypothetical protein